MSITKAKRPPANAGAAVVYKKSVAFNTAHISDGVGADVYTPVVDEVLLQAWVIVTTAWDDIFSFGDIGTGIGSNTGLFFAANNAVNMAVAAEDGGASDSGGAGILHGAIGETTQISLIAATAGGSGEPVAPNVFTANNPIKVWVTQDGLLNGVSPSAAQGAADIYLVIATPVSL